MSNKNFVLITIILAAVAAFSILTYLPNKNASDKEAQMADFPKRIGEWEATDIPLSANDLAILETNNLIMREYKNVSTQDIIYLYIIYSAGNRKVVHPPEICYSGGGATIIEKSTVPVTNTIQANKFTVEDKDSRQLVSYWFRSGNFNTYNYMQQQLKMVINRTLRKKTSGAMIRVSTTIKDNNQEAALSLIKSFCGQIQPILDKYIP